jgi:phosphomannomutase
MSKENRENTEVDVLLERAGNGIQNYLREARASGRIDQQSYEQAIANTFPTLKDWLKDDRLSEISPYLRRGLIAAMQAQESKAPEMAWKDIVDAFRQAARFGTGGIRGMMAFDRESIVKLKQDGITAPILKGSNTINDIVLLKTSAGVAQFGRAQKPAFEKVVIGYDSRIRGYDFAALAAQLFLAYGYTVYFFDEPGPYPEMTFAIPYRGIKADIGILISASHNDYRYNGYKLSCGNGSQFDPEQRNEMYDRYIANVRTADIRLCPFDQAPKDKLIFLGGDERISDFNYRGLEDRVMDIHREHGNHVKSFLLTENLAEQQRQNPQKALRIAYCAFHGAGRRAVPRLLQDVGFPKENIIPITEGGLNDLDGLFPSFCSEPGREQQPDPGDPRAAGAAVKQFKEQLAKNPQSPWKYDDMDILIGTDPDADRCGVVVKVPSAQRDVYQQWQKRLYGDGWDLLPADSILLPADSMWALLLWYRLNHQPRDNDKKFIVLSHTTSDNIVLLARKHGLGVVKTWVGFAALAAAVRDVWEGRPMPPLVEGRPNNDFLIMDKDGKCKENVCHPFVCEYQDMDNGKRSINVAAMEQSNGFSILGGPPPDGRSLGVGGHVRDKDGTMAALLVAEIAAWAKQRGTTLFELIDKHINLDPDIGLFVNHYEPDPMDGEYPGIEGDRKKKEILRRALGYFQLALSGDLAIAGRRVTSAVIYRTGKYDKVYQPTYDFQFPDEGIRFYFEDKFNHATVRPSGTGNSLRFHIQLRAIAAEGDLVEKKRQLYGGALAIADDLRKILKSPRC